MFPFKFLFKLNEIFQTLSLVGAGALLTAALTWIRFRPKDRADTRKTDADTAETLVKMATELAQRASDQCAATSLELSETSRELGEALRINEEQRVIIIEHQKRLEIKIREHSDCMAEVKLLQQRIHELTAPPRRQTPND